MPNLVYFALLKEIIDNPKTKEKDVQKAFIRGLDIVGWQYYRIANESIARIGGLGYYQTERSMGFKKGVVDLEVIVDNKLIKIELKKARKNQSGYSVPKPSPEQVAYIAQMHSCGLYAFVLATPEDFTLFFEQNFITLQARAIPSLS